MPDRETSGQTEADSNRFESLMAARGAVNKSVDKANRSRDQGKAGRTERFLHPSRWPRGLHRAGVALIGRSETSKKRD